MSIKSEIRKFFEKVIKKVMEKIGKHEEELNPVPGLEPSPTPSPSPSPTPDPGQTSFKPVSFPNPSLASCWEGSNAQTRHMNELSPGFTDKQVEERLDWAKNRGCNTVHWFVCNQGDGEKSGYSIYGKDPKPGSPDKSTVALMANRIRMAAKRGMAVVLWLMADDSSRWNETLLSNISGYVNDLKKSGLLDMASGVVLGLEMNEYIKSKSVAKKLADTVRKAYSGPIGTHHTSGSGEFAAYGDYLYWQMAPKQGTEAIKRSVKAAQAYGKPVIAFELERNPNRNSCNAAMAAGAKGVGNW